MGCGHPVYGTANPVDGNGNGFKMGGNVTNTRHMIRNCVSWKNKAAGFYSNHSTGGHTWYNNTAFQNGSDFNMLSGPSNAPIQLTGALAHILRNNISYTNKNSNMGGADTAFNTWDLNITPKASDFLSITDPSVSGTGEAIEASSPAFGPRQADGSLPNIDFLKLAAGSQMIDKGTDVGLPIVGAKPDLGAYEYGATTSTPGTGGATGAGGTPGTGGATATGGKAAGGAGATATGGKTGAGGAQTGGAPGVGGTAATGGRTGSGTGGLAGTGGTVATGGSPALTGGTVASGGTAETGGLPASGGLASTGGVENGGNPASGGTSAIVAAGGTTSATSVVESNGCSCRIAGAPTRSHGGLVLLGLVMVALRVRKRR
jgi:MYXO-CTERM domain-containing protein